MRGTENKTVIHSSFQECLLPSAIAKSQSISPVAFFSMMTASALALATLAPVSAFVFSTLPSSHVLAIEDMGPMSAVSISISFLLGANGC